MKDKLTFSASLVLALFSALAPTAGASTRWYVNGVTGSDTNNCLSSATACKTIGHAISLAHSGDTVMVASATYTENLTIGISLNVVGTGASTTIVDGEGMWGWCSHHRRCRIPNTAVTVSSTNAHVSLSGLTIENGAGVKGGGISNVGTLTIKSSTVTGNTGFNGGGGLYNTGTVTIFDSTISGNTSTVAGNAGFSPGGGLYNTGTVTIFDSTISGNTALSALVYCDSFFCEYIAWGGGIYNAGSLTVLDTTVSGNNVASAFSCPRLYECVSIVWGGGIDQTSGSSTVTNSTITANSLSCDVSQKCDAHGGGILLGGGNASVSNSTVAEIA